MSDKARTMENRLLTGKRTRPKRTRQKNRKGDREGESKDSLEILDNKHLWSASQCQSAYSSDPVSSVLYAIYALGKACILRVR